MKKASQAVSNQESLVTLASQRAAHPISRETQKNNGLLFQFILSEFLEAYEEIKKLSALGGNREAPLPLDIALLLVPGRSAELVHDILLKLLGSSKGGISYFSWNFADGLLNKLHTYSVLLQENCDLFEKELIAMHHYIEKMRSGCSSAMEAMNRKLTDRKEFAAVIDKVLQAMQRLAKLIVRMVQQFREDENVIFFILRHKAQFDRLYGNRFILKLLNRIYPKGLHEVEQLLCKKYAARGFNNVLHLIHTLISELDLEYERAERTVN